MGSIVENTRLQKLIRTLFFQAEDGIRDVERSRGLGDVYKRQADVNLSIIGTLY